MGAKSDVLSKLESMLLHLYSLGDGRTNSDEWRTQRARIEGFIEACKLIEICKGKEVQELIDQAHIATFGESRAERKARLRDLNQHIEQRDWDIFDTPTFERKK
jgi:hypothetical protein